MDIAPSAAETTTAIGGAFIGAVALGALVVGHWRLFAKAQQPGWAILVPFLYPWVLLKMAGKSPWWLVLLALPGINAIALVFVWASIARKFGKGFLFGVGLALLPVIFVPILGFGPAYFDPHD